jgi:translation elongation factor EF-Tu-like GTPase
MLAHFLVEETFSLSSRRLFVVHGRILDGVVRRGQRVRAPSGLDAPVEAIEFVLLSVNPGRENPALAFRYRDVAELARWQALGLAGQTLELADGGELSRDRDAAV